MIVQTIMLLNGEIWNLNADNQQQLERNEVSMLHWICNVSVFNQWVTNKLREKLGSNRIICNIAYKRAGCSKLMMMICEREREETPSVTCS